MYKFAKLIMGVMLATLFSIGISSVTYAAAYGVVTGSSVNVRADDVVNSENRLFQVQQGQSIEVNGVSGDFFRVTVEGTSNVYISREFVRIREAVGIAASSFIWAYDLPSQMGGMPTTMFRAGDAIRIVSTFENWYGVDIDGTTAFIEKFHISTPYFVEDLPVARIANGSLAEEIISTAKEYLGTRYLWGGTTPNGFDCSGFMVFLFTPHGIALNRHSGDMARNGIHIPREELMPADLVFFGSGRISHVGMYIGDGYFIHSSTNTTGVIISSMFSDFNMRNYITARRVI
ncbi:MAG: NlpC/P60 family protein [Defluviitaleaceae bacterium]|nr:NlpC/P60 family protein [Defluviitaleaceae bacterium]